MAALKGQLALFPIPVLDPPSRASNTPVIPLGLNQKELRDYTVFDLETTGLFDPEERRPRVPQPVEIAAQRFSPSGQSEFHTLVRPTIPISPGATKTHGLTAFDVARAPSGKTATQNLLEFARGSVLVGHNIQQYDIKVLAPYMRKMRGMGTFPVLDTYRLARKLYPEEESYKLSALAKKFGAPTPGHRAKADVAATSFLAQKFISEAGGLEKAYALQGDIFQVGLNPFISKPYTGQLSFKFPYLFQIQQQEERAIRASIGPEYFQQRDELWKEFLLGKQENPLSPDEAAGLHQSKFVGPESKITKAVDKIASTLKEPKISLRSSLKRAGLKSFSFLKDYPLEIGIGAILLGQAIFSGRDRDYNTIEGLPHGGLAEQQRRILTAFGSGRQRDHIFDDPFKQRHQIIEDLLKFAGIEKMPSGNFSVPMGESSLKSAMRGLARKYHPDMGGSGQAFGMLKETLDEVARGGCIKREFLDWDYGERFGGRSYQTRAAEKKQTSSSRPPYEDSVHKEYGKREREYEGAKKERDHWNTYGQREREKWNREQARREAEDAAWETKDKAWREREVDDFFDGLNEKHKARQAELWEKIEKEIGEELKQDLPSLRDYKKTLEQQARSRRNLKTFGYISLGILGAYGAYRLFSGRDDDYNTIEGLKHTGLAGQQRRILTDFGSGFLGQGKVSSKIAGLMLRPIIKTGQSLLKRVALPGATTGEVVLPIGLRGKVPVLGFHQTLEESIINIGGSSSFGEIFNRARVAASALISPYGSIAAYNPTAIEQLSKEAKFSAGLIEKETRAHERFHQTISFLGLRGEVQRASKLVPPEAATWLKGQGYHPSKFPEEYLAYAHGLRSATDKIPELFKPAEKLLSQLPGLKLPRISGKDDAYNTIEGLKHGGMAEKLRKLLTEFSSGWRGQEEERKDIPLFTLGATASAMYAFRGSDLWANKPMDITDYIQQFKSAKYKPGDIIFSRNVLYDEPFHAAVIGDDKLVYQAFPGEEGGKAVIWRESVEEYIRGSLKIHAKEGMPYPLVGVASQRGITPEQATLIGKTAREQYELYKAGKVSPKYSMEANRGFNEINCLSFVAETHKQVGKEFFIPGTTKAYPWAINLTNFDWMTKGPEKVFGKHQFSKMSAAVGGLSLGLGVATMDPGLIAYGAGAIGLAMATPRIAEFPYVKASPLAGFYLPASLKSPFRRSLIPLATAAVALPAAYMASRDINQFDSKSLLNIAAVGAVSYLGYQTYKSYGGFNYDPSSKRLLIMADLPEGAAQGHMAPAKATAAWLKKHGWEADVFGGFTDLSKVKESGRAYRAFFDAGYNVQWPAGLPGVAMQWDIQTPELVKRGAFRSHLRPFLGLSSEGMAFVVPTSGIASGYKASVGQSNFYAFDTLTINPEAVERMEAIREHVKAGTLNLPNIAAGEKFVTVSGGGIGVGVSEAVRTLAESKWLEETGRKAVIFSAALEKNRPEEFKELKKIIEKDKSRYILYNMAEGSPGRMLPEYMVAADINLIAAGASTSIEATVAQKPFIGFYGGGMPNSSHFIGNLEYMRERFGAVAKNIKIPELAEEGGAAAQEMRSMLESTLLDSNKAVIRVPSSADLDVGQKLIGIIEAAEKQGHLKPSFFRPSLAGMIFPLYSSSVWKKIALVGAGTVAVAGLAKGYSQDDIPKKGDSYTPIEGLNEQGLAAKLRKTDTDFGSKFDPVRALARNAKLYYKDFLKGKEFQEALSKATVVKTLGSGVFGEVEMMETRIQGEKFQFIRKRFWEDEKIIEKYMRETPIEQRAAHIEKEKHFFTAHHEAEMLSRLEDTRFAPTPYGHGDKHLYMELMPGKTIYDASRAGGLTSHAKKDIREQTFENIKEIAEAGIFSPDIKSDNLMIDMFAEGGPRVSWIDWGVSRPVQSVALEMGSTVEQARGVSKRFMEAKFNQSFGGDFGVNVSMPSFAEEIPDAVGSAAQSVAQGPRARRLSPRPPGETGPFPEDLGRASTILPPPLSFLSTERASMSSIFQAQNLENAQKSLWESGRGGGRGHNRRAQSVVIHPDKKMSGGI